MDINKKWRKLIRSSNTKKLKLFKWDTNTDRNEEFDINKALNENWDKIDVGIEDNLSKTYTGTNITADTVKGVGRVNKVRGFCKQETREGYNLVDFSNIISIYKANATFKNDILTVTSDKVNGYANCSYDISDLITNNPGKILRFECEEYNFSNGNKPDVQILIENNDDTKTYFTLLNYHGTFNNYTIPDDVSNIKTARIRIVVNNTTNDGIYSISITKPMLLFGTEQKLYEAYGASPSLEFPAKIHSLGDDKNLFDINSHIELNGQYRGYVNGNISNNTNFSGLKVPVKPKKEYIISTDVSLSSLSNMCFFDEDMTYISGLPYNTSNRAFTTPENCAYVTLAIDKKFKWFKLQEGTVATPWSPFGYGITTNKSETINKLNLDKLQVFNGKQYVSTADYSNKGSILLKKNTTYTVVSDIKFYDCGIFLYDENGAGGRITTTVVKDKYIYKFNSGNDNSLGFYIGGFEETSGATTFDTVEDFWSKTKVMLLEGEYTSANLPDYVQHEEDTQTTCLKEPLLGIGDIRDELDLSNKKIIRRFGKKVFDGTETWHTGQDMGEVMRFYSSSLNLPQNTSFGMSNYFKWLKHYTDNSEHFYIGSDGYLYIFIDKEACPNTASFKTWLSEHPVEIIYPLEEPVIESIDCSDKIAQYDGQTTVYNTDNAEIEVSLTNNKAIAQINQNLQRIEEVIASLKAGE